jgi:non-ribosomal peptide synthetase-like protein
VLKDIVNGANDPTMTSPLLKPRLDEVAAVESGYAEVLADVLGVDAVPGGSHFFDDLDADSMVMARFCARVRKRDDLPTVSMKDIYRHPTVTSLAVAFGQTAPDDDKSVDRAVHSAPEEPVAETPSGSTPRYVLCGLLQALIALAYAYLTASVADWGFGWLDQRTDLATTDLRTTYIHAVEVSTVTLLGMCLIPILAKWILIGRWKPRTIQVWTLAYVRFWAVKTLTRTNPLVLFAGSPIYTLYLRLLGAKIGKRVTVYSPTTVCTDLLTIGDDTVIRKDAQLPGYRAVAGVIEVGPITLGNNVIIGEQTVIDINSSLGDGARLGHSSSVHAGQHIGPDEFWHGSPARPSGSRYPNIDPARCGSLRRLVYSLWQLVIPVGVYAPLLIAAPVLLARVPRLAPLLDSGPPTLTQWTYYREVALHTAVLALLYGLLNFAIVMIVPRMLNLGLKPGRVYPLFGYHYWLHRTIARRTNSGFFMELVGDSSYVVHYLRALGYTLGRYEQTGSNFGAGVKHDNPYLCSVGPGTMVADGLSMINADYSSTSFRLSEVSVGERSFLGNGIAYPAQSRVGGNTLLGTMTMVPIDGPMRENTGLLGAPSFQIPRTVERDTQLEVTDDGERRRLLRAKNRHNTATIIMFLIARFIPVYLTVLLGETAVLNATLGPLALLGLSSASTAAGLVFYVFLQRVSNRWQAVVPEGCSIYNRAFWRHERYWKLPAQGWMQAFNGTPFKPLVWRALGVHIGRRVFDDGFAMPEKSLVTIGDDCTLNAGSGVQCHSQEDGAFKSDRTALGNGVTLGVGAFVHYGVTIGDGAVLAPETFVMKGEDLPPQTRWIGNPAALAISTSTAYPPAPAALPADSAPVAAALATRPRAVVEWNGQDWSFPEVDHYTEPVDGPVTRVRIDRPGTLRLTGSGDNLRIELIPDDPDNAALIPIGLPPPREVLTYADGKPSDIRPRALTRPYAAGVLFIAAMLGGGAALVDVTHILPTSNMVPNSNCEAGTAGCATTAVPHTEPSKTQRAVPSQTKPDDTAPDDGKPDDTTPGNTTAGETPPRIAMPPRQNEAPGIHPPSPEFAHRPVPVVRKPPPAPARRPVPGLVPAPAGRTPSGTAGTSPPYSAQSPAGRTHPNSTTNPNSTTTSPNSATTEPDGSIINSDGSITNPNGTITKPDGTTSTKKKKKKSSSRSPTSA